MAKTFSGKENLGIIKDFDSEVVVPSHHRFREYIEEWRSHGRNRGGICPLTSVTLGLGICSNSKSLGVGWGGVGWADKSVKLTVRLSSVLFNQCSILLGKCVCQLNTV